MFDSRRVAGILAGAVGATVLAGLGAGPAFAASRQPAPSGQRTAVAVLDTAHPVTVPGVALVAYLSHLHEEVVRADPAGLARLARAPGVTGVTPNEELHVAALPRSAVADSAGVYAAQAVGGAAGSSAAGSGVNVAVLDTGLSDTPALDRSSGRVTDGVDVSGLLAGSVSTDGTFSDGYGHGTFLSSLIAGGPDRPGGASVGVAPGARIVVVKVANDKGDTSLVQVLAGMDWVAAHARAIRVLTVALSAIPPASPHYGADPLTEAVRHVADSGVLPVVAAGNDPGRVGSPGDDPSALTVGAADTSVGNPRVAAFSGYGNVDGVAKPDLVAPGEHLLGELPAGVVRAQNYPDAPATQDLFPASGTSMAAAVTSGVAAIFFSEHPDATVTQAKASLRAAATPLDGAPSVAAGAGLVAVPSTELSGPAVTQWANESGFNSGQWRRYAWLHGVWMSRLTKAWSPPAWSASTWSASTWSASTWSASTWSASTWSASTWSASTWSASTWSASTWSASTWSASTWSASTWSASTWSASTWSASTWSDASWS